MTDTHTVEEKLDKKLLFDHLDRWEKMNEKAFGAKAHFCMICGMSPTVLRENIENIIREEVVAIFDDIHKIVPDKTFGDLQRTEMFKFFNDLGELEESIKAKWEIE